MGIKIETIASGSRGNAYLVSDGHSSLLLECGINIKSIEIAVHFNLHNIEACLITHEHNDHAKCHKELIKRGVEIYGSNGTIKALNLDGYATPMDPQQQFSIGSFIVQGFLVEHDAAEPFGYHIYSKHVQESIVFITDTKYVRYRFKDLDYIMCECNYDEESIIANTGCLDYSEHLSKRVINSHMSLETCAEFININKSKKLKAVYLLHMSDRNSNEVAAKNKIMALTGVPVYIAS